MNSQIYELLLNMDKKIDDIKNTMVTNDHCKERQNNCKHALSNKRIIALYSVISGMIMGIVTIILKFS